MDEITCQIVYSLSQVNIWNKSNGKMVKMYNARGHMKKFSYVGFSSLCQVIKYFTLLNLNLGGKDITFPLSYSSRAI